MTPSPTAEARNNFYAYHVPNPFKEVKCFFDKDGCACFMTTEQFLSECQKPGSRFHRTKLDILMPQLCLAFGFLMLCFLIGSAL